MSESYATPHGTLLAELSGRRSLWIVSVITDPVVVDRVLLHRKTKGIESPFARAPPAV
jgi:hypothetical protein